MELLANHEIDYVYNHHAASIDHTDYAVGPAEHFREAVVVRECPYKMKNKIFDWDTSKKKGFGNIQRYEWRMNV